MMALATIGLFNILGSYLCGALGGRYSKKMILVWIYVIRAIAIGAFIALPLTAFSVYGFAAIMGITWLGTVPLTNALVGQIFGVKYLSTLFSVCFLGHQLGAFAGSWVAGSAFDLVGSYQPVWLLSIALSVLAALLCLPIDERSIARPALGSAA
jgi:predicted MFS family arabinose efflux permease